MKVVALFVVAAEKSSSSFSSSSEKECSRRKAKSRENNLVPSFEVFGNTDDGTMVSLAIFYDSDFALKTIRSSSSSIKCVVSQREDEDVLTFSNHPRRFEKRRRVSRDGNSLI